MGASTADKPSEDIDVSLMDDYRPCAHVHHFTYVLHIMGIVSYVEYSLDLQPRIICELKKGEFKSIVAFQKSMNPYHIGLSSSTRVFRH